MKLTKEQADRAVRFGVQRGEIRPTKAPRASRRELEGQFQQRLVECAMRMGWVVRHVRDARRQNLVGLPDLILVHPEWGEVIFAELKSETGALRPEQVTYFRACEQAVRRAQRQAAPYMAAEVQPVFRTFMWRPSDEAEAMRVLSHGRLK